MSRNQLVGGVFAMLGILLAGLIYLNFFASPPRDLTRPQAVADGPTEDSLALPLRDPGVPPKDPERTLLLYFQGVDVGLLFPEERVTTGPEDGNAQARQVLDELVKGPHKELLPTIPDGTRVREVYFDASGVAYVDFSAEIRDNHPGGSAEELMTVDSVVHSLTRNVPQVQAVRFLIEGRPVATLAGHVDLSVAVRPRTSGLALSP